MIVNKTMFSVMPTYSQVSRMRQTFDDLQLQLATGRVAQTLSDMGPDRNAGIDLRNQLNRTGAYQDNITMVGTRLDVLDLVISRMDTIESEARGFAASDSAGENQVNLATAQNYARSHLDEMINLLNTNIDGRYMFAGSITDVVPVAGIDEILNGEGGRDGFRTIVSERKLADAGASGMGRLSLSRVTDTVTLSEDGVHPFGFKLSGASTTSTAVAISAPAGSPPSMGVTFSGQPNAGEKVFVTLTLPDSTTMTIALEASTQASPGAGKFTIGATTDDTAASFETALQTALLEQGETELSAASVFAAADDFFNASGQVAQRVDGPPFDTATALVAATGADTVDWYQGSSSSDPRASVTARVSDQASVSYGVEGNEKGFLELMRSLAAVAVETFPASDPTAEKRYDALTDRQTARLAESNNNAPGSLEVIAMELGVVRNAMGNYSQLNANYEIQLESVLSKLEDAPMEEVAIQITSMQVRLEASYKTMSIVSQLTLVNFIK